VKRGTAGFFRAAGADETLALAEVSKFGSSRRLQKGGDMYRVVRRRGNTASRGGSFGTSMLASSGRNQPAGAAFGGRTPIAPILHRWL
jgi:hypothetical protein